MGTMEYGESGMSFGTGGMIGNIPDGFDGNWNLFEDIPAPLPYKRKELKSEGMIPAPAEAGKNIENAAAKICEEVFYHEGQ